MIKVTWRHRNGQTTLQVAEGSSLMDAAVAGGIPGIEGECGGAMMCATCHVNVSHGPVGEPDPVETDMLDMAAAARTQQSRLSCQLVAGPELDGAVLVVPDGEG